MSVLMSVLMPRLNLYVHFLRSLFDYQTICLWVDCIVFLIFQGDWGLTEEDSIADIKRIADFTKTFIPTTRAQLRVLHQSYQVCTHS